MPNRKYILQKVYTVQSDVFDGLIVAIFSSKELAEEAVRKLELEQKDAEYKDVYYISEHVLDPD